MIRDSFEEVKISQNALDKLIEEYLEHNSGSGKNTKMTYYHTLKEFSEYFSRHKNFTFQLDDVRKYRWYLSSRKKLKEYSVATYFSSLRRFFNFLTNKGILKKNPARRIKIKIKNPTEKISFLERDEINKLLRSFETNDTAAARDKAILMLLLHSALSIEEVKDLNVNDFYIRGRSRKLRVAGIGEIKLNRECSDAISFYIEKSELKVNSPMFISYSNRSMGKRISTRGIKALIIKRLGESGIEKTDGMKLSPLTIRNTAALIMASGGAKKDQLMLRFGFRLKSSADRIYGLLDKFDKSQA